jgi:hypothetical protein
MGRAVARLDGGDDDEDGLQDPEDGEEKESHQHQAKDRGDKVVMSIESWKLTASLPCASI